MCATRPMPVTVPMSTVSTPKVHGRIEIATLSVPDLEAVARAYGKELGYREVCRGRLDSELAASWGAPEQAGRRWRLLLPESGAEVYLRLVEGESGPDAGALRTTLGWAALEHTVADTDHLAERLSKAGSAFTIIGPPQPLEGLSSIYPMQVLGPAGEVLYLTEVRGSMAGHDLPRARCAVDQVFIVVLGVDDLEASLRAYGERFAFPPADRYELPYKMINQAFGLPAEQRHQLATTAAGSGLNVEIDQYPPQARPRRRAPGLLPSGIAMVSFGVRHLEEVVGPFLAEPGRRELPPYAGRLAATCVGPAGELVELIELPRSALDDSQ